MSSLVIDMTSFEDTHRSSLECFGIEDNETLMDEYFLSRERDELSVTDFISYLGTTTAPILESSLTLVSLHVTTNNDHCSSILESGIMDLQGAVTENTPLRAYLNERNIVIDVLKRELYSNGQLYQLNRHAKGSSLNHGDDLLGHVAMKIYKDFPVCGFICTKNALDYGGNVNRRPEILNNLSNALQLPYLVEEWEQLTQAYIVKFGLPLNKYEVPHDRLVVGKLLLQTSFDFINDSKPLEDVYSFLLPSAKVEPYEIMAIFSEQEYKDLIES